MQIRYQPQSFIFLESKNDSFQLKQYSPHQALQSHISCYWRLSFQAPISSSGYPLMIRLIPDGCIDLTFMLTSKMQGPSAFVTGLIPKFQDIVHLAQKPLHLLAIRFLPGGAYPFLKIPLCEIPLEWMSIELFLGKTWLDLEEKLLSISDWANQIQILDEFLLKQQIALSVDNHVLEEMKFSLSKKRNISLRQLTKEMDLGSRQVRRRFHEHIGLSPKKFARLFRIQNLLRQLHFNQKPNWPDLAYQFGYYDQAHLIHDFQEFVGFSPQIYIKNKKMSVKMSDFSNTIPPSFL